MTTERTGTKVGLLGQASPGLAGFRRELDRALPSFESMLGDAMTPAQFVEMVTTAYIKEPYLAKCDPASMLLAVRRSAQLRLRPDSVEGAFIPRGGKVFFEPMVQGVIRTMLRTGTVRKIEAHVVKSADVWEYALGLDPILRHVPATPSGERGSTTFAYAIVWLTNGERQFEVMDIDELEHIRQTTKKNNKGKEGPAWTNHPDEMRRKIVVKRLAKYIEQDPHLAAVIAYDHSIASGVPIDPADSDPTLETRTVEERATEHADRQTDELRGRMADLKAQSDVTKARMEEEIEEADAEVVDSEPVPAPPPEAY